MTDSEINYLTMARAAHRELTDSQPQWQPLAPAMQADYAVLVQQLDTARTLVAQQSQQGTKGYTNAKDRAEQEAEEAAGRLVRGLRALQLDHPSPALAQAASYVPSTLNRLRGEVLLGALDTIAATADGAAALLAAQGVTAAHRQRLADAIAAFRPLVGTPRTQVVAGAATTATLRKLVKELRTTFARLDTRVDNLRDDLPALATRYEQAREILDAGHGPKTPPAGV